MVGDARANNPYKNVDYNTIICLEVLEHIREDIKILQNVEKSAHVICSVPNFNAPSHVRWFTSERQIKRRYFRFVDISKILKIGNIYLFQGIRSDFRPNILQVLLATREPIRFSSLMIRIKHRLRNIFKLRGF